MDEKKQICKQLRDAFSASGWALLAYNGIMNVCVTVVIAVSVAALLIVSAAAPDLKPHEMEQMLMDAVAGNGWGYLLAVLVGLVLMFLWKKKEFCLKTLWKPGKPMKIGAFFAILTVFMLPQAISQLMTPLLEWLFGFSLTESMNAGAATDTFSMFLYVCLMAPISEEILFRGLILRTLEPYGIKFAILASSFLFGIFHGNLVQTPYAFLVGLVLGYVTVEYNVIWAMLLHMINNLLLADSLTRVTASLPLVAQQIIFAAVVWGFAIAAVVILICRRRAVAAYFRQGKIHPLCLKSFFTAPGILVLTAVMLVNIVLSVLLSFL